MHQPNLKYIGRERNRRWFVPVFTGLVCATYAAAGVAMIQLSRVMIDTRFVLRGLVGFALGSGFGIVLVWAWLKIRCLRVPASKDLSVWILGSLAVVLMGELVVRTPYVDRIIWTAMRARAPDVRAGNLRGAARVRSLMAETKHLPKQSRVILVGSSQLNFAVQDALLTAALPEVRVERWLMAAMGPLRMLMIGHRIRPQPSDVIIVYWSEFDMGTMTAPGSTWFRPVANGPGFLSLMRHLPRGELQKNCKSVLDLGLASIFALWRTRDVWQMLITSAAGAQPQALRPVASIEQMQKDGYWRGMTNEDYFTAALRASATLVAQWRSEGAHVIILEGSVNPWMDAPMTAVRRQEVREHLTRLAEETGAHYRPLARQEFQPTDEDWLDVVHFTEDAGKRFTGYLTRLIRALQEEG